MAQKRIYLFIVWLVSSLMLSSCGSGTNDLVGIDGEHSTRIYLLASQQGRLTAAEPGNTSSTSRILTLEKVEPSALWYSDRPDREIGSTLVKDYVNVLWRNIYGGINPNATVQFQLNDSTNLHGLYASLSSPAYDEKSKTLTFHLEILGESANASEVELLSLANVTVNVLNNAEDDEEVSSYIQYAAQAVFQPTTDSSQYKVILSDAGPDMFWVDNAPGKYSDKRPMSYFFPQWPYVFDNNPPNAALFGTTATGKLKLYILTLTDPVYDESLGQVSYTATLLGQTPGPVEAINDAILSIDSGLFSRFPIPAKGTAYQALGQGYDPSTANNSYIYFGSDIARRQMGSLWGTQSNLSQSCAPYCRNDLQKMKDLGINLIRLYDWEPRNDHSQFLDYANSLNLKVVVPISNWLPTQGPAVWDEQVPNYLKKGNFGNNTGTDWHPAVAGVIISNELDKEYGGIYYDNAIGVAGRFLQEVNKKGFSKSVPVGVPVTFVPRGAPYGPNGRNLPSWNQFDKLLTDPRTAPYKDQIMLAAQTYNSKEYLFSNAEGIGEGWVPLTYKQFDAPIFFTEIGLSRTEKYYTPQYIKDQLQGVLNYQKENPQQVLGAMHFQFDNKVWKQTPDDSDSEGAFGMFRHGNVLKQIQTVAEDYNFYISEANGNYGSLVIDQLDQTTTYAPVVEAYK